MLMEETAIQEPAYRDPALSREIQRVGFSAKSRIPFYVITVNHNSDEHVRKLIGSLSQAKSLRRLIIVDHAQSQALRRLRAPFPITIVRQANRGYGSGLNRGLKEISDSDAVALLCNPDITVVNPEFIDHVIDYLDDNPAVGCVVPTLLNKHFKHATSYRRFYNLKSLLASRIPWLRNNPPTFLREHLCLDMEARDPFPVDWGCGAAMFCRTSLFPSTVSFDERYFLYFEDVDLCAQIWQKGLSVVCYPRLVCFHYERRQSQRRLYYFLVHLHSFLKYVKKYNGLPTRYALMADHGSHSLPPSKRLPAEQYDIRGLLLPSP